MTSLSHKIAWNTFVQIAGKVVTTTLGVLITVLLTRYLGPAGFGSYIFILVFVLLFGNLADWGLSLITVREASKNDQTAQEIVGNALVIRLILSVVALIAANLAIHFSPSWQSYIPLVAVASISLLFVSLKTSFQIVFNVKLQMQNWAISELAANGLGIFVVLFLISHQANLEAILWAFNFGQFAAAAVAAYLGYRLLPLKFSFSAPTTRYLLLEALPMGTILVLFTIYNRVDTIILEYFKGNEAVGYYGAAYRVYEVLVLGAAYFANSILPVISNLAQTDRVKMGLVYRKSFVILLFMGLAVALVNFFLAPLAIAIIAGPKFVGSVWALQILSLGLVVSYFNHINGYTIIALGKQWYSLAIAVVALIINILLNILFIPQYSYPAAAFITFITEGLIVFLSLWVINRELHTLPHPSDIYNVARELIIKRGQIF